MYTEDFIKLVSGSQVPVFSKDCLSLQEISPHWNGNSKGTSFDLKKNLLAYQT
jgi:hypothetical protein